MKTITRATLTVLAGAALLAGCSSSSSSSSVEGVTKDLQKAGVCDKSEVRAGSGPIKHSSPSASKVTKTLWCTSGDHDTVVAFFGSTQDRDTAAADFRGISSVLVGTGDNQWIMQAASEESAASIAAQYGDGAQLQKDTH